LKFLSIGKGVFLQRKMYGLTFKERNDLPVYPDVKVYEVYDTDGKSIAIII
jgi:peptidyl-dipeptidase Dcp